MGQVPTEVSALPNNLPVQLTSFVGRDRELTELGELLGSTRLLTLTGAGGCGKTRLALQLAAHAVNRYPGGAWCLELAPLSDPALIESALATMLGVRPLPGRTPVEAAVFHLAALRALVLLDNCEHVLEPCRQLADALLRGCPDITVVATSREPLGVGGRRLGACRRWGTPTQRACSSSAPPRSGRTSRSPPTPLPTWPRSARSSMASRSPSSWPPRACASCRSSASPLSSPTASTC